ncbi:MAG: hypothetical protein ACKO7D_06055, partial [Bacteroidota bacterium]
KNVLENYKSSAKLSLSSGNDDVAIHLLNEFRRVEEVKMALVTQLAKKKPETVNILFGEIAQSFEKSIFANLPKVNTRNSFLNAHHLRKLFPDHENHHSIPEKLCDEYNLLIIDIYVVPIPTAILQEIRSEMKASGLTGRLLNFQKTLLVDLIQSLEPKTVRFICRYKSLVSDSRKLVDDLKNENLEGSTLLFENSVLSGNWGLLDSVKWMNFIKNC